MLCLDTPKIQIAILSLLCITVLVVAGIYRPFKDARLNLAIIVSEAVQVVIMLAMLYITITDSEDRTEEDNAMIGRIMVLAGVINVFVILIFSILSLIFKKKLRDKSIAKDPLNNGENKINPMKSKKKSFKKSKVMKQKENVARPPQVVSSSNYQHSNFFRALEF